YNPNVTDADVEAYIQRHGGTVGPSPEHSGQQARPPQFRSGQGIHQPPAGGTEESGPEGFPPPPTQPPAGEPGAGEPAGEQAPTTPGPGFEPPQPPPSYDLDGEQIPVE